MKSEELKESDMAGLLKITVSELLDNAASKFPDHEALVDVPSGMRYSYRNVLEKVNRFA
jgi:fatty-acyl-CoA synthase